MDISKNKIFTKIYQKVYVKLNENHIDVFLCGGAGKSSFRDKIKKGLKSEHIRILYPEDLFIELLNQNKNNDLLTFERFLADNVDVICIVCESAGSLVELGAFTNSATRDKVIALIDETRKRNKSFIMLGPIKLLDKNDPKSVMYYNSKDLKHQKKLVNDLKILIESKQRKSINNKVLNSIIGIYNFVPLILYFFKEMRADELSVYLKNLLEEKGDNVDNFTTLLRSSLKLLYKDKSIIKTIKIGVSYYSLSENGYKRINKLLKSSYISYASDLYDNIRFDIMRSGYIV